jgi:tRNA-uridine 2-sulfurtransferase
MAKIIVGMSGGVDSSVAAALLLEQGHQVEGVFMKNWSPDTIQSLSDCPWEQDLADAERVCQQLGIPFRSVNFEREYKERVVDYFLAEYAAGRTPNPDILCNSEIKFKAFLDFALEQGADGIATGHYARVISGDSPVLQRGADAGKDQSYFLYGLDQRQLAHAYFPVGELEKAAVRQKAQSLNLINAAKKDSQGICFIGHIDLKKFLLEAIGARPGTTYLLPEPREDEPFSERFLRALVVGEHRGSIFYTVGERAGDAIDNGTLRYYLGNTTIPPVYVVATEASNNRLYVSIDPRDKHLFSTQMVLESWHTTGSESDMSVVATVESLAHEGKIVAQARYQQQPVAVHSMRQTAKGIELLTDPLRAVATGQSLVLYEGDRVWGGGVICATEHLIASA